MVELEVMINQESPKGPRAYAMSGIEDTLCIASTQRCHAG